MVPTRLPYEIQIKYLLELPSSSILNYCQVNRRARKICEDPWFWKQKAEREFGFSYQIGEINPAEDYISIENVYNNHPKDLLPLLIYYRRNDLVEKLLPRADLSSEEDLLGLFDTIFETNNAEALSLLLKKISIPGDILRGFFFSALGAGKNDLLKVLAQYYNPMTDNRNNLHDAYLVSIDGEYFPVLDYLLPLIDPDGYHAFSYSLENLREATFEHLVQKYPQLFRNLINPLREEVVRGGDFEGLELLEKYL